MVDVESGRERRLTEGSEDEEPAWAPDGVVEAIEREGSPWVLGVQWHPEWMAESPVQQRLLQCFVTKTSEVAL